MARRVGGNPTGRRYEEIEKFEWDTEVLRDEGVLDFCDPNTEVEPADKTIIVDNITNDVNDRSFRQLLSHSGMAEFSLAFGKFSNLVDELRRGSSYAKSGLRGIRYSTPYHEFIKLPKFLAVSIMINYAIYLSQKRSAATFTEDPLFHQLLLRKFRHLKAGQSIPQLMDTLRAARLVGSEIGVQSIFNEAIPDLRFKSFDDVLYVREHIRDELLAVREICINADIMPWDSDSRSKVANAAHKTISDLSRKITTSRDRLIRNLFIGTSFGFAAEVFLGVPVWASLLAGVAPTTAIEAADLWKMRKQRSRLTFLLRPFLGNAGSQRTSYPWRVV